MKALVTGSSGFIGKALFRGLEEDGWEVVPFDRVVSVHPDAPALRAL